MIPWNQLRWRLMFDTSGESGDICDQLQHWSTSTSSGSLIHSLSHSDKFWDLSSTNGSCKWQDWVRRLWICRQTTPDNDPESSIWLGMTMFQVLQGPSLPSIIHYNFTQGNRHILQPPPSYSYCPTRRRSSNLEFKNFHYPTSGRVFDWKWITDLHISSEGWD
jgi:hypothetical protein